MTSTETPASSSNVTTGSTAAPRTLSILSLVAAIASVSLGHLVILPLAAIVLGFIARQREPQARTMSTWGIAIGFVVLFWWLVVGAIALSVWLPIAVLSNAV
jgi:hypothetical protein